MFHKLGHNRTRVTLRVGIALVSALSLLGAIAPIPVQAAGNAGIHLAKTVDPAQITVNPALGLTLGVDKAAAIPADTLTYTANVTNGYSVFGIGGTFTAEALGNTDATVAYYWDELQSCAKGCGNGTDAGNPHWVSFGGFVAGQPGYTPVQTPDIATGLTLTAAGVPATGVTYPTSGDPILGTTITPKSTASWTYQSTFIATPTQIAFLSDPNQVQALRNVVHFEVTVRNSNAAEPYIDAEPFTNPFQSQPNVGSVSNIAVTFTLPDGSKATVNSSQVAGLALLAPGGAIAVTTTFKVPVPSARATGETDDAYLARLKALEGSALNATASASGTGFSGTRTASTPKVTTIEHLPIVTIAKSGPTELIAGNTELNPLSLENIGGSAAASLAVTDSLPGGATGTVTGLPASLAPAQTGSAQATYAVPDSQTPGNLTDTAAVTWQDANGNAYGPLTSSFTTNVKSSLANAKLTLAPTTAGPDVVGNTQSFTAHLADSTGQPVPNRPITLSITGANPQTLTANTNAAGDAPFVYTGANKGTDQVQATLTVGTVTLQSNTVSVSWIVPIKTVSTTLVNATVYHNSCRCFNSTPATPPVFSIQVPTINFNPPFGTIPHNPTNIDVFSRPMFDVTTDVAGNFTGAIELKGVDSSGVLHEAGNGDLFEFDMVLTGTFTIASAGNLTFNFFSDDGFIFGVPGGAIRVSGPLVNPPNSMLTAFNSYPVMGAFNNPTAPVANNVTVNFPTSGTYPYEIDYNECCSGQLALTLAINGTGLPPTGNIALTPFNIAPIAVGQTQILHAAVMDASGVAIANQPVTLNVTGANPQQLTGVTDSTGLATFGYQGAIDGVDHVQASAQVSGVPELSNVVDVPWRPAPPAPTIGAASPADGAIVTKPIPITANIAPPTGQTISSWNVTYQAAGGPPVQIGQGGAGAPPNQLATFDPTLLTNGSYTITITANASGGGQQTLQSTIAVLGSLKPGRYVTSYQDLSVSIAGLPMQVIRTYDSTDKSPGDFGVGWKVGIADFRVASNRILGAGGWTQYNKSCVLGLCFTAFKNASARFVTVVFPDQHVEDFDFTPAGGTNVFFGCTPAFTSRASEGATSTLQPVDDTSCSYTGDGNLYGANGLYSPKQFRLTTKDGRVLLLDTRIGLISETDTFGNALSISAAGVISTLGPASSPTAGPAITYTRDSQGRITDVNGPLSGQHIHYTYYPAVNELQTVTDPNGNVDTYTYDPTFGNLSSVTGPGGVAISTLTYSPSGRLNSVSVDGQPAVTISTDPGLQSQTFNDPNGKLTTVLTYDSLGDVVQKDEIVSGQTPLTSKAQYDSVGRVTDSIDPAGNETKFQYDESATASNGNVLSVSQVNLNRSWSYQNYNSLGEPGQIVQPDGSVLLTLSYDPNTGAVQSTQAPGQAPTTFSYSPAGRLKQKVDPAGRQVNYTYDSIGHLVSVGDGTNPATQLSIDAGGLLRSVTDSVGSQIKYDYWPDGQLKTVTDGRNNVWQYFYDGLGRLDHTIDPVLAITQYHYNAAGQLDQVTDRNHAVTTYTYDVDGSLVRETRPGNDLVNFGYDPRGLLIEADNAASHVDRLYDLVGRLQSETTCANTGSSSTSCPAPGTSGGALPVVKISYQYWPDGQIKQMTSSDTGAAVNYTYDANGRPQTISDPTNPNASFGYTYDALGRTSTLRQPNGIVNSFSYNQSGDLTAEHAALNGNPVANFDYQVDPVTGRWTQLTDSSGAHAFTYYVNGSLKSESHPTASGLPNQTYSYDAADNRSAGNVTSQFDAANRLQTDGAFAYTFDSEGNLTSKAPVGGGAPTTYAWNSDHQMTSITYPNGTSSAYQYDAFGRRVKSQDPSSTTAFVFDGLDVHADYNGQGQLQTSYLPQLESVSGTTPSYYLADGLGTIRNTTSSTGAITASSAYSAWGIPAAGNSTGNRYTFTGYQYDQASGLYFAGSRYYDPTTGRFLSEDPQGANNAYPYAANNPVSTVDVRGEGPLFDYAQGLLNAYSNAECVAGVASAIATSAFSATMSALAGGHVTSDQATTAIGIGVGIAVGQCAANFPGGGGRGGNNVQRNRAIGLAFERQIAGELTKSGFRILATHRSVWTRFGRREIDILAERNGSVVAFEIKYNTSVYKPDQIAKDAWMAIVGVDTEINGKIVHIQIPTILIRGT